VAIVCAYEVDAEGRGWVTVNDPWFAHARIQYSFLQSAYGMGAWVETLLDLR